MAAKKKEPKKNKDLTKSKNKGGRPTSYNLKLGTRICDLVATHTEGLKHLCAQFDWMPVRDTINEWRWKHNEFAVMYTKAKLSQAELMAEDCIDIADDGTHDTILKTNNNGEEYEIANAEWINRSRLRVDTRKWIASKLLPRMYGEHNKIESLEGQNEALRAELRELRDKLDAQNKKEY